MSLATLFGPEPEIEDEYDAAAHRNALGQLRLSAAGGLGHLIRFFRNERPSTCLQALKQAGLASVAVPQPAPLQGSFLWFIGRDRGCERGLCCMYSMWFDPKYVCVRKCTHRCNFSRGSLTHCGPSLLEDCLLARYFEKFAREYPDAVRPWKLPEAIPSRFHGDRAIFCKRRPVAKRVPGQESNLTPQTLSPPPLPRPLDRFHLVQISDPKPKRARNPRCASAISRIGKCLGSTSFGRLRKKRTEKVSRIPGGVEPPLSPTRIRRTRKNTPPAKKQKTS